MEKLERVTQEVLLGKSMPEPKKYSGLQLVEEKIYMAGTSIKYWM